tara:strand:- start:15022 stop:15396 length:375 start_codon:yes stop_codon:yes gene_type:complete
MKNIVIFEDGKGARGIRAKFIKRDKRRVLIQFLKYDFETDKEELVSEWFKLYIPAYTENKKEYKYNNKRNYQMYCHEETNMFYSDYYQTEKYRLEMKEALTKEYYEQLFGWVEVEKIKEKVDEF